ncbi:hypothetical protein T265_08959 [Opisthorchis viverrini]|uniref:Uncharacterized protein n=1 Tax=Opisthorchis viverrini TaxID=6198 RepID=A0A074Z7E3_OPIVI|nr:hypothetical protein T265_08959 [Opisthorchis viverrini]KER23106.1 hypothetical protein T265_08959 [Opisthorchis viverrini]
MRPSRPATEADLKERRNGISLDPKGRAYRATPVTVLLNRCKARPLRTDDARRLQVFEDRCPESRLVMVDFSVLVIRRSENGHLIVRWVLQSGKTPPISASDSSVMCCTCRNTVYRDVCCALRLLQDGANPEVNTTLLSRKPRESTASPMDV